MNVQQTRIANSFADEVMDDIDEMGCFEPEMIRHVATRLLTHADKREQR